MRADEVLAAVARLELGLQLVAADEALDHEVGRVCARLHGPQDVGHAIADQRQRVVEQIRYDRVVGIELEDQIVIVQHDVRAAGSRAAHAEVLAAAVGVHERATEGLLEEGPVRLGRRFAGRRDADQVLELKLAGALLLREDLDRSRVAGQEVRLKLVEPRDDLGQRAIDLEATDVDEPLRYPALDRADHRDARVVAVDRGVVSEAELTLALALRLSAALPVRAADPVERRIDEVADLARGARRVDHAVLAEEELARVVRAGEEVGDRLLRDAGRGRDLVEALHQQRLREQGEVARAAAVHVDLALRDDPAVVRRALVHVAHEPAEFLELHDLELGAAELSLAPDGARFPDRG